MIPENFIEVGTKLFIIIAGWSFGILAAVAIAFLIIHFAMSPYSDGPIFIAGFSGLFAVIAAAFLVVSLIPFQGEYHKLYRVSGEVTSVSNVLSEASGDLTRTPVIELDTVDRSIAMEDPRAVGLEGRDVTLTCTIGWRYQAADRYACEIYEIAPE